MWIYYSFVCGYLSFNTILCFLCCWLGQSAINPSNSDETNMNIRAQKTMIFTGNVFGVQIENSWDFKARYGFSWVFVYLMSGNLQGINLSIAAVVVIVDAVETRLKTFSLKKHFSTKLKVYLNSIIIILLTFSVIISVYYLIPKQRNSLKSPSSLDRPISNPYENIKTS